MKYQIFWSEDVDPTLTEEQKEAYSELGMEQVYPIGNEVDNRRLFHGIGTKEVIDNMLEYIAYKTPLVIRVEDKMGIEYGFEKIITQEATEDTPEVTEIVAIEVLDGEEAVIPYLKEDSTNFFEDIDGEDEEGNAIKITVPHHGFAGWENGGF